MKTLFAICLMFGGMLGAYWALDTFGTGVGLLATIAYIAFVILLNVWHAEAIRR